MASLRSPPPPSPSPDYMKQPPARHFRTGATRLTKTRSSPPPVRYRCCQSPAGRASPHAKALRGVTSHLLGRRGAYYNLIDFKHKKVLENTYGRNGRHCPHGERMRQVWSTPYKTRLQLVLLLRTLAAHHRPPATVAADKSPSRPKRASSQFLTQRQHYCRVDPTFL